MTVKQLIGFLQKQQQDMQVAYCLHSEQCLLNVDDIVIADLCANRDDGWIQNKRPDKKTVKYLLFPGN